MRGTAAVAATPPYSFGRGDTPVLFETMVFGGAHDCWQDRYCTWDEAAAGHTATVERVKKSVLDGEKKTTD